MRTIGIRELRQRSATFIQRAGAGEQMIITVSGTPVASLGPVAVPAAHQRTLLDLTSNGSVIAARRRDKYKLPPPIAVQSGRRIDQALREVRG